MIPAQRSDTVRKWTSRTLYVLAAGLLGGGASLAMAACYGPAYPEPTCTTTADCIRSNGQNWVCVPGTSGGSGHCEYNSPSDGGGGDASADH